MLVVALLYVAGGALPLAGLVLAFSKGRRQYMQLVEKTRYLDRIVTRTGKKPTSEDIDYWLKMYGMDTPGAAHQAQWMYAPEIAQKAIWAELKSPSYFAGAGIVLGTAGSLLSLAL